MKIYWTNFKFINVQKSKIIVKGLTIFFLLILLSEYSFSQNHYSYLSNKEVCEEATYIDGSRWKNYFDNNEVINEALLRNLSINSCKVLTNRTNKIIKEKSIEIKNKIGQPVFCKYHKDIYYIKQSKNKKVIDDSDSFWNQSLYRGLSNGCGLNSKQISLSEFCKRHSTQILNFCSDEAIDDVKVVKLPKKKPVTERVSISPDINVDEQGPIIDINDYIKINKRNFSILGVVTDDSNVFVEVDGKSISVINNSFSINGSTSIGKNTLEIIAFDQWGNETKKDIVIERIIETATDTIFYDELNPNDLKTQYKKNRIALIIGIEEYENISNANFAKRDGQYFIDYVQSAFGVPDENIKYLFNEDATEKSKFIIKRWLKKNVNKDTEVYMYFSGHGMALNEGKDLYLLTNDTYPDFLAESAINRNEIFNDIAQYYPMKVTVFLDTCYSGAGRADGEMLLAMAKGLVIVDENKEMLPNNFTLFTAATAQESAWSLPEAKHGAFSYFLMKGIEGKADLNKDNILTNGELHEYLIENVGRHAQQKQTPQMIGDPNQILVRF